MWRFYLGLWLVWVARMLSVSLLLSAFFSLLVTASLYLYKGLPPMEAEVNAALAEIATFWFLLLLNLTLPLALFINLKYLFNHCVNAIALRLRSCSLKNSNEYLDPVEYGDLRKVWRKWFLLIIWISSVMVLFSFLIFYFFVSSGSFFEWLSVYHLYSYILLSGFFALTLFGSRCKSVSLKKC